MGEYNLVPQVVYSSSEVPIQIWTPEMPRIEDLILDCIVYLYPSVEEAKRGVKYGGAGFLIQIQTELPFVPMLPGIEEGPLFRYVVTNKHVISGGCTVVRVNTRDGQTDEIPLSRNQWQEHPDADLAVAQIESLDYFAGYKVRFIPDEYLLTEDAVKALNIGPGDDVYMVGRFMSHDGKQKNQPFVQSGIISLMPTDVETEWDEEGEPTKTEELFLVEMRSLSGCSGSPVFFEFPIPYPSKRIQPEHRNLTERRWLLGIDCGHFHTYEEVVEVVKQRRKRRYVPTSYEAKTNAGQMMVVPAWKLKELLDHPRFAIVRKQETEKETQKKIDEMANSPFSQDVRIPNEQGLTQEAFEEALHRASRKIDGADEQEVK